MRLNSKTRMVFLFTVSCVLVGVLYFFHDVKEPSCANAQTCYSILPEVRYARTGMTSCYSFDGCYGCASGIMVLSSFDTQLKSNKYEAALTGFEFETYKKNDEASDRHVRRERVSIGDPYHGGGNVLNIPYEVCFHDEDTHNDDGFVYNLGVVAYAWE